MKILSLILDGHGRLTAELCVSPDLKRREIAAATGAAEIVWCGIAAHGQKSGDVLASLQHHVEGHGTERCGRAVLRSAVWTAYLLTVIRPAVAKAVGRIRRAFRRPLSTIAHRLRDGLVQAPRTP